MNAEKGDHECTVTIVCLCESVCVCLCETVIDKIIASKGASEV